MFTTKTYWEAWGKHMESKKRRKKKKATKGKDKDLIIRISMSFKNLLYKLFFKC